MAREYFYDLVVKAKTIGRDTFTYKSSEPLPLNSLVEVDFNGRKTLGLVVKALAKPNFDPKKIKAIVKIVDTSFLLDQTSLDLAKIAADFYYTSFGKVVFWAMPQIARRLANKNFFVIARSETTKQSQAQIATLPLVARNDKKEKVKINKALFLQADIWQRFAFYKKEIKEQLEKGKQVLLLSPNLDSWLVKKLAQAFTGVIISPKETRTKNYLAWKKATQNKAQLVIGSQKAIFLPLLKLGLILVEDEGNPSFKQEQDPKIEVSYLAQELAKLRGAKLILTGLTPLPSTYLEIQKKQIAFQSVFKTKPAKVVDLAKESKLLGFRTELALTQALEKNEMTILFFNRLGLSQLLLCPDCGFSNFSETNQANLAICPICSSTKITGHSFGLERMVYDLKKLFPQKTILDLAKRSLSKASADVIVATSFAFKFETQFALAILGLAEIGLSLPDPMIAYKIFHFGMEALSRGRKKIVQSFTSDHLLIKALANLDIDQFYGYWLKIRQEFKLYPFYKTFKILPKQVKDLEKIKKQLNRIKGIEVVYKLVDGKESYLLASCKYDSKIENDLRPKLLKLSAKITVDPI